MADMDTSAESLLAHVFAIAALRGTTPRTILEELWHNLGDDSTWYAEYLPVIMGDPDAITDR
jgi:hypothetical protein